MGRTWIVAASTAIATMALFAIGWLADWTWMRIAFGLPVILLLPGGLLVWILFPAERVGERRNLTWLERLVLSVGVSVVLVGLLAVAVEVAGHFEEAPFVLLLLLLESVLLAGAVLRSTRLPEPDRWPAWEPATLTTSTIVLGLLALGATGALVGFMASPKEPVEFTELALLGSTGARSCYPAAFVNGTYYTYTVNRINQTSVEPGCPIPADRITIVASRRGGDSADYQLTVWWATGDGVQPIAERQVETRSLRLPTQDGSTNGVFVHELRLSPPPSPGKHFLVVQLHEGNPSITAGSVLPDVDHEVRLAIEQP